MRMIKTMAANRTYRSQHSNRVWQMWNAGRGYRTIVHWDGVDADNWNGRQVARIQTNSRWSTVGNRMVVTWDVYQDNGVLVTGGHKSAIAAFKAFTKSL